MADANGHSEQAGSGAEPHPTHDGRPCVESLDGDGQPLGYCVTCYQPVTGRIPSPKRAL